MALTGSTPRAPTGGATGRAPQVPPESPAFAADRRWLVLLSTAATAFAALLATVALGGVGLPGAQLPALVYALVLVPGLMLGTRGRAVINISEENLSRGLIVASFLIVVAVVGARFERSIQHVDLIAHLAALAVVPLSLLWPQVKAQRYSVLLSTAAVLGAAVATTSGPLWAVGGFVVAAVVSLAATSRLDGVMHTPLGTPHTRRRLGRDAAIFVLVVAGMALVMAAIIPPPKGASRSFDSLRRLFGSGLGASGSGPGKPGTPHVLTPLSSLDAGAAQGKASNDVLLRISADHGSLWRTQTFASWNGRSWSPSDVEQPGPGGPLFDAQVVGDIGLAPGVGDTGAGGEELTQHVVVEADVATVLAAAPRAARLTLPSDTDVLATADGALEPSPPLAKGDSYVVKSTVVRAGPAQLRAADPLAAPVPGDIAARYLPLPEVSQRVQALGAAITRAAPDGYDKVAALQQWLVAHTRQVSVAPALAAGVDPVDQYLFVDRRGTPVEAASALAVLVREAGIPARLAVGFTAGHRSLLGGPYLVRQHDAYAWVEVWFPGFGWQAFDAAGRIVPTNAAPARSLLSQLLRLWPLWLALAVGLALLMVAVRRRRASAARAEARWSTVSFARLVAIGVAFDRSPMASETPAEYARALAATELHDERLVEVGHLLTAAAWSGRATAPERQAWADGVIADAEASAVAAAAERRKGRRRRRRDPVGVGPP